jgi:Zn-dependent peptidase ImmA (M78 family)
MRALALEKRRLYGVETPKLNLTVMRRVYKAEGITIDGRTLSGNNIRASYFCDDGDYSVLLNKDLPREPKLFSLAHELKHHYVDQKIIQGGLIRCGDYNRNEFIEKAAEVFAAEFIYPEDEMRALAASLGVNAHTCTKETVVEFKRACQACISYTFVVKRFEWFGFCPRGTYDKVQFQKLEEEIYGLPIYKQEWFKKQRAAARKKNHI